VWCDWYAEIAVIGSIYANANRLLDSAKSGHIEPAVKKLIMVTYQGKGCQCWISSDMVIVSGWIFS